MKRLGHLNFGCLNFGLTLFSLLMGQPFPGNIRELENIIEYAFISCKESIIGIEHLSADLVKNHMERKSIVSERGGEEAEKIRTILQRHVNNRSKAARELGMSRTTLWRKMKQCGLMKH